MDKSSPSNEPKKHQKVKVDKKSVAAAEEDLEDPVEKLLNKAGCLDKHYKVQECIAEFHDWRKCQQEVENFRLCIEEHKKQEARN